MKPVDIPPPTPTPADKRLRAKLIADNFCPECLGELDTGWECNSCDYDALGERDESERNKA